MLRDWSVRNARFLEIFYNLFEKVLIKLHPLWNFIGYQRVERPVAVFEKAVKGMLFDCQMCGNCVLSSTGMSCPMNCPKNIRNGPCGGVGVNGECEVDSSMTCVWVRAWEGSQRMKANKFNDHQVVLDWSYKGKSSWLRVAKKNNN
tara:strand:- start:1802 stop:2239 length:438 start_codon:yes stop_codon:yes gene_type:complete